MRPFLELLDDPGELTDRRVREAIRYRLRPRGLNLKVTIPVGHELVEPFQAARLGLGEGGEVAGIHRSKRDKAKGRGVDVDADDLVGCDPAQFWGDKRAQVPPLGPIPLVT